MKAKQIIIRASISCFLVF